MTPSMRTGLLLVCNNLHSHTVRSSLLINLPTDSAAPVILSHIHRAAALTTQNHMTNYFRKAKEHGVQWQLNRSYCLTCTPGHVAAQFNWHHSGNCTTVSVDTVVLGECQAACVSKITVELTIFLPCTLMSETE